MMEMVGEGIIDVKGREIEIMDRRALQNMF